MIQEYTDQIIPEFFMPAEIIQASAGYLKDLRKCKEHLQHGKLDTMKRYLH